MNNCLYQVSLAKPKQMSLRVSVSKGIKKYIIMIITEDLTFKINLIIINCHTSLDHSQNYYTLLRK